MRPSLWHKSLQKLRDLIPQQQFSQWISPLQAQERDNKVVIYAPNKYILDGVMEDYYPLIEQAITALDETGSVAVSIRVGAQELLSRSQPTALGAVVGVDDLPLVKDEPLQLKPLEKIPEKKKNFAARGPARGVKEEIRKTPEPISLSAGSHNIDVDVPNNLVPGFTFETFVEGKSNQLAKAAAFQVAENPGTAYNPLFLYGGVGLGKTHLMHAVGNAIVKKTSGKVLYLHSERFVANMVRALQDNSINEFKRFYRELDALLIDDIQFFAGKDRSQEEFFHTFNALLEGQQQIILTSDRYPKEIIGIEERLKSRFGSGLTVAVEPPELETRVAILINKAKQCGVDLPHEIAFFIAKKIRSNVRELEGALKRVIANSSFSGKVITQDLVQEALKDLLAVQDKLVSVDNIIKTVADYYKIKVVDILSKSKNRAVSRPRQVAMYLCKELTDHSLPEIGAAFGRRDHTTVLHACKQVSKLKQTMVDMNEDLHNLFKILTT